jgi:hypothetical protein
VKAASVLNQAMEQDSRFYTMKEYLDEKKPSNRAKTDAQRKKQLIGMGFDIQLDEKGVEGISVATGGKVMRKGTRYASSKLQREAHDDRASMELVHQKNKKGLTVKSITEAGWPYCVV